jgi:hypothetical protein
MDNRCGYGANYDQQVIPFKPIIGNAVDGGFPQCIITPEGYGATILNDFGKTVVDNFRSQV